MNPYPSKPIAPWRAAAGALLITLAAIITGCPRMHAPPPPEMVAPPPPPKQDSPAPLPEPEPKRPQNPLRTVPDNACKDDRMEIVDILPIDNQPNHLKLFHNPQGGHDLFWMTVHSKSQGGNDFVTYKTTISDDGTEEIGPRHRLEPNNMRFITRGDQRYSAISMHNPGTWRARVVTLDFDKDGKPTTTRYTPIPLEGFSHSQAAIAWNPVDRQWGLVWEEYFNIDSDKPGYVFGRLYFARLDERGAWIPGSERPLSANIKTQTTQISGWHNPLIWDGEGFALAWSLNGLDTGTQVYLSELDAEGRTKRQTLLEDIPKSGASSRIVVASDSKGTFALAWGSMNDSDSFHLKVATVTQGVASKPLYIGSTRQYSNDPSITYGNGHFAVAWNEGSHNGTDAWFARFKASPDHPPQPCKTLLTHETFHGNDFMPHVTTHQGRFWITLQHKINPSIGRIITLTPQ